MDVRRSSKVRDLLPPFLLLAGVAALWQLLAWGLRVPKYILPSPAQIVEAGVSQWQLLAWHSAQTLAETGLGLVLAIACGFGLAVAIDLSTLLRRALYPLLVASQTVPIMALAPLLVIWFGYGTAPKAIVVGLVCFFPVVVATADGLRAADPELLALLRSMGATRRQILLKVRLPGALPGFFSGLKIAITYSVIGAVIGEWVAAGRGLGVYMIRASNSFLTERVFAAIGVTSLLSIVLFLAVTAAERLALPWYYTALREEQWEEVG
ncbi:MAG: ABC transporter permease [Anaerolineae bacterium]|nr:ABC transporter permease [Anaerolineae bacterium]